MHSCQSLGILEVEVDQVDWRVGVEVVVFEVGSIEHLHFLLADELGELLEPVLVVNRFQ